MQNLLTVNAASKNDFLKIGQNDSQFDKANRNFRSISKYAKKEKNVKANRGMNFQQQKNKMEPFDQNLIESCPLPITDEAISHISAIA